MRVPNIRINHEQFIGARAGVVYRNLILAHEEVQLARARSYQAPPSLQQRLPMTDSVHALIETAMDRRTRTEIPFWQAMMLTILDSGVVPDDLLNAALFHQGSGVSDDLTRGDLERGELDVRACIQNSVVSLDSCLDLEDECAHLAFMDFRVTPCEANTQLVKAVCQRLMPDGFVVLTSTRSYHACGVALQHPNERIEFLGRSLLFSPIVDDRYVAHQLMQPSSSLRISAPTESDSTPRVVAIWYPS